MAEKQYIKGCKQLSAAPRSKRRQLLGAGTGGATAAGNSGGQAGDGLFISKVKDDTAEGHISFAAGATVAEGQRWYFKDITHYLELDEDGRFHFSHDVYSDGDMVAGGKSAIGDGGTGGGASYLFDLLDVSVAGVANGHALVYRNGKWVNEAIAAGLDTSQLAQYLASNNYAKKSDIPSLAGYLTQTAANGLYQPKGNYALATDLDGYLSLTGGTLTGPLKMGGNGIKRIYFADNEHYLELDEDGRFHFSHDVYSDGDMVAGGKSAIGDGGAGSGASYLFDLLDVSVAGVANGHALVYRNGKWVNEAIAAGLDTAQLAQYLTANNYAKKNDIPSLASYATQTWVQQQEYLKEHQSLAGYATQSWVEGKGYALASALNNYLPLTGGTLTGPLKMGGDGVKRIYFADNEHYLELNEDGNFCFSHNVYSVGDMVAGGKAPAGSGSVAASYMSDLLDVSLTGVVNGHALVYRNGKWVNEAIAAGLDESALASYLSSHNYITSAALNDYATTAQLGNFVTLDTAQTIGGIKTFPNGFKLTTATSWTAGDRAIPFSRYDDNSVVQYYNTDTNIGLTFNANTGALKAGAFVKRGGTSSQFLKANGDVDNTQYLYHRRVAATTALNIDTGIAAVGGGLYEINKATGTLPFAADWHKVFDWGTNDSGYRVQILTSYVTDGSLYLRHKVSGTWHPWRTIVDNANYSSILDGRYVKKSGDTMTGALTVPKINITGTANSTAYITADNATNIYINIDGRSPLVCNSLENTVRPSLSQSNVWSLGSTLSRWSNVYSVLGDFTGMITTTDRFSSTRSTGDGYHYYFNNETVGVTGGIGTSSAGPGAYLWLTGANNSWRFATNATERMRITGGGNIGVNTTNPLDKVHIYNGLIRVSYPDDNRHLKISYGGMQFYASSTTGWAGGLNVYSNSGTPLGVAAGYYGDKNELHYMFYGGTYESPTMIILPNKTVVVGATTNSSGAKLHVAGNIYSTGDQVSASSSDRRLKQRFAVEDYAARILRLGVVMDFDWSERARAMDSGRYDALRHTSVVWQRARKVGIPGFCGMDEHGYGYVNWLGKDYQASLLGAVQQTIKEVMQHGDEIKRLRRRVSDLEAIIGFDNKMCA